VDLLLLLLLLVKPLQLVRVFGIGTVLLQKTFKSCLVELFLQYYHFCDISKFCVLLLLHADVGALTTKSVRDVVFKTTAAACCCWSSF
jgi:hypothetical protein